MNETIRKQIMAIQDSGKKRKELVWAMSEILGEDASYQGASTSAFKIDGYTVSRDGLVTCPDTAAREEIDHLVDALKEKGFLPENALENNTPESVSEDSAPEHETENIATDGDISFSVELPREGFSRKPLATSRKSSPVKLLCLKNSWRRLAGGRNLAEAVPAAEAEGGTPYEK